MCCCAQYVLKWFPGPNALPAPSLPVTPSTGPDTSTPASGATNADTTDATDPTATDQALEPPRTPPLLSPPYQGVDFVMIEVVDVLQKIRWAHILFQPSSLTQQATPPLTLFDGPPRQHLPVLC